MSHEAFQSIPRFTKELNAFDSGLVISGSITKTDLTEYLMHLKKEYFSNGIKREYQMAEVLGYVGNNYWYLQEEVSNYYTNQDSHFFNIL
jgi:hypothetical protein